MLIHNQESHRILHVSQFAKVHDNASVDSYSIRRENLDLLIREAGSKAELARRTGVSEGYLNQITGAQPLDGREFRVGPKLARALEKGMGRPRGWMDLSHDQEAPASDVVAIKWVPLRSWAEATAVGTRAVDDHSKVPTTAIIAGRPISERSFALRVSGDSMVNPNGRPTYPPGCTIIVDPDREPMNGDRVIVRAPDLEEPIFKVYTVDAGRKFLRALNPQFPIVPWVAGMKVLGVVVQTIIDE